MLLLLLFHLLQDRSKILRNFYNLLNENQEELATIVSMESVRKCFVQDIIAFLLFGVLFFNKLVFDQQSFEYDDPGY